MSGISTKDGAKRKYNTGGKTTVLSWDRKYGRQEDLGIKVKIMTQREEFERKSLDCELMVRLVLEKRKLMPLVGTRNLYYSLKKEFLSHGI